MVHDVQQQASQPGQVLHVAGSLFVFTGLGFLEILLLSYEGEMMSGTCFLMHNSDCVAWDGL